MLHPIIRLAYRKILVTFIICILLSATIITGLSEQLDYTVKGYKINLYKDGVADIECKIDVDPSKPRINVTLFGNIYSNLIILDQNGLPLEYVVNEGYISVDVLGSYEVEITYNTPDLTNKTGSTWSISLNPSTQVMIQLPIETIILGLDPIPDAIAMTSTGMVLTLPPGTFKITYAFGVAGTRDVALVKINEAESKIQELRNKNINVSVSEQLLYNSRKEYEQENYVQAQDYAEQAINRAQETESKAEEASRKIDIADKSISSAEESGRTNKLGEALYKFEEAIKAYSSGEYEKAATLANEAMDLANSSTIPEGFNKVMYTVPLVGFIFIGLVFISYRKLKSINEAKDVISLQDIFDRNLQLRADEKEVIEFIAQKPKGIFASDLRDQFDLPRSTAWRMINRLEEAEILETSLIGRETHMKIAKKYRRTPD